MNKNRINQNLNKPKDIMYIKNILTLLFGMDYENKPNTIGGTYYDYDPSIEIEDDRINPQRIDPKKLTFYAYCCVSDTNSKYGKGLDTIEDQIKKNKILQLIYKNRYINSKDIVFLIIGNEPRSSDVEMFHRKAEDRYSDEEKILYKGFIDTLTIDDLMKCCTLLEDRTADAIRMYLNKGYIYERFISLPLKDFLDKTNASLLSLSKIIDGHNQYVLNLGEMDRRELYKKISFLRMIVKDLIDAINNPNYKKNNALDYNLEILLEPTRQLLEDIKNNAKDGKYWIEQKNNPFYLINILVESGLCIFQPEELENIINSFKEMLDTITDEVKNTLIELLQSLYENEEKNNALLEFLYEKEANKEKKDSFNDKEFIAKCLEIFDIDVNDLKNKLDATTNKKRKTRDFKKDIISVLNDHQKKRIQEMSAEEIKSVINEYIKSNVKLDFIREYINRLIELKDLDLATIIGLVQKGDINNTDVLRYAINNVIDIPTLQEYVKEIQKMDTKFTHAKSIEQDFSKELNPEKLAELFGYMRKQKKDTEEHSKAENEFKIYAGLYELYKQDKKGIEIERFLKAFKKQGRNSSTIPLDSDEIIYLYELGLLRCEYALQPNTHINILNETNEKNRKNVDNVRIGIIRKLIERGTLQNAHAKILFKKHIEDLHNKNSTITKQTFDNTLLGKVLRGVSDEGSILSVIYACEFNEDVENAIMAICLSNTYEIKGLPERKSKDTNGSGHALEKNPYEKISSKERYVTISGLDICDKAMSINNGVITLKSVLYNLCIIEQQYTKRIKNGKPVFQTGEHYSYVMSMDYFIQNEDEFLSTITDGDNMYLSYDFSRLFHLCMEDNTGNICRVPHRKQENNKNIMVTTWKNGLLKAIKKVSGKDIEYKENEGKNKV